MKRTTIRLFLIAYFASCTIQGQDLETNDKGEIVGLTLGGIASWSVDPSKPKYHKVEFVTFQNCKVSADELKSVSTLPALNSLILGYLPEGVEVEDHALEALNSPRLETLDLCKSELKDSDLSFLPRLTGLKYLTIAILDDRKPYGLSDMAASWVVQLPELTKLRISGQNSFTDRFVERIVSLPKLQKLTIASDSLTDESLSSLSKKTSLQQLRIGSRRFTNRGMKALFDSKSLRYLSIRLPEGTEVQAHVLDAINPPKLQGLEVFKPDLKDGDLSFLPRLTGLQYLILEEENSRSKDPGAHPGLSDGAALLIAQLPELAEIDILWHTTLTDRFVEEIASLPKLRRLNISSDSFTDESILLLAKKPGLKKLLMYSSRFTERGMKALRDFQIRTDSVVDPRWRFAPERFEDKDLSGDEQQPNQPK